MEHISELIHLSSLMGLETAEDSGCSRIPDRRRDDLYITNAVLPNGNRIPLLKTLLSSACERNCYYCPFRAGRNFRRATLSPEEMAKVFMSLYRAGIVQGLFLSSGMTGGSLLAQDKLIDTTEILRNKLHYTGYIHLKIMPGAESAQIERLMHLADRISINFEAPNSIRLGFLAPKKNFDQEIITSLHTVRKIRQNLPPDKAWNGHWPSVTTQFVVGPAGESDTELLATTFFLYKQFNLGRVYFMAFNPILDTPFENIPATEPMRELRLYQASFLLRDYGFHPEEIPLNDRGLLSLISDPKKAWADQHLIQDPVEVNDADKMTLMRIPGIGPKSANKIIKTRLKNRINGMEDLKRAGINTARASAYILINGKQPNYQHSLFSFPAK